MDLKAALEYLFGRLKAERPVLVAHPENGQVYAVEADGTLGDPVRELAPQWTMPTFQVATLSGLVELHKANVDDFHSDGEPRCALHVADYRNVKLISLEADEFGRRHVFAHAVHAAETPFKFGEYHQAEKFLIDFRCSFLFNDEAVKVVNLVSNLESGMSVNVADDGVSQSLEVKAGTTSKAGIKIPAEGISLIPWRTFRDAAPVESKFLLRLKGVKDGLPMVALYDIDQKWQLDTVGSIAKYLQKHVPDATIIA